MDWICGALRPTKERLVRALEGRAAEGRLPSGGCLSAAPTPASGSQPRLPAPTPRTFEGTEEALQNTNNFRPSDPNWSPILMLMRGLGSSLKGKLLIVGNLPQVWTLGTGPESLGLFPMYPALGAAWRPTVLTSPLVGWEVPQLRGGNLEGPYPIRKKWSGPFPVSPCNLLLLCPRCFVHLIRLR